MVSEYVATAERFGHDAIFIHPNPNRTEEALHIIDRIHETTGDRYFLMLHGDATVDIPNGNRVESFSFRLCGEPESVVGADPSWTG